VSVIGQGVGDGDGLEWFRRCSGGKIEDMFPEGRRMVKTLYYGVVVAGWKVSKGVSVYIRSIVEGTMCFRTMGIVSTEMARGKGLWRVTFSIPKNLSPPSSLMGPASARNFSSAVGRGALGSLFAVGVPFADEVLLWRITGQSGMFQVKVTSQTGHRWRQRRGLSHWGINIQRHL
jgi:hypothetical protein